jgi:hypothetical protein
MSSPNLSNRLIYKKILKRYFSSSSFFTLNAKVMKNNGEKYVVLHDKTTKIIFLTLIL